MKKYFRLTAAVVLLAIITIPACKKDSTTDPDNAAFLNFDFDGNARSFTHTHCDLYFWGDYAESYIGYSDNGIMIFNEDEDDITRDTLMNLVGRKLPLSLAGSGTTGRVLFDEGSDYYDSQDASNPFPANYFKITKVTFTNQEDVSLAHYYYYLIEGEFVCNVNAGGSDVHLTNGKLKMGFVVVEFD